MISFLGMAQDLFLAKSKLVPALQIALASASDTFRCNVLCLLLAPSGHEHCAERFLLSRGEADVRSDTRDFRF
jgi:hypothetical protein